MKVPSPRAPGRPEIPDTPEEAARYLDQWHGPRDKQVEDITSALQGKLSPLDNFNYERKKIYLLHNSKTRIQLEKVRHPFKVEVEWVEVDDFWRDKWQPLDQDEVEVTVKFDTDPGVLTLVHLGIWGD